MLTIITPCSRQNNIQNLYDSIKFDKINKWIIVYDTSKNRSYKKLYKGNPKIIEVGCDDIGISGNSQRNYGMTLVNDGYIYFLDDDNIIHPNFWSIIDSLDNDFFYTFNQLRQDNTFIGNNIKVGMIDTAMFVVHKNHIKNIKWNVDRYDADGYFISDVFNNNRSKHKFINQIGSYYNFLN